MRRPGAINVLGKSVICKTIRGYNQKMCVLINDVILVKLIFHLGNKL